MQINEKTKYSEFAPIEKYLTEDSVRALKDSAEKRYGSMYSLDFGTFHECVDDDMTSVLGDTTDPTVLQVYWKKRFAEFIDEFVNAMNAMTIPKTSDEIQASHGLLKQEWDESLLVFIQTFFGLKSYKDAEKITLGEILIARKVVFNREKFRRQMTNILRRKMNNNDKSWIL